MYINKIKLIDSFSITKIIENCFNNIIWNYSSKICLNLLEINKNRETKLKLFFIKVVIGFNKKNSWFNFNRNLYCY